MKKTAAGPDLCRKDQRDDSQQRRHNNDEGKVTIINTKPTEQRVNNDVGEYVDFKEIKD